MEMERIELPSGYWIASHSHIYALFTDKYGGDFIVAKGTNIPALKEFAAAMNAQAARIERLEKALRWYVGIHEHPTAFALDALKNDEGKVAKEALESA